MKNAKILLAIIFTSLMSYGQWRNCFDTNSKIGIEEWCSNPKTSNAECSILLINIIVMYDYCTKLEITETSTYPVKSIKYATYKLIVELLGDTTEEYNLCNYSTFWNIRPDDPEYMNKFKINSIAGNKMFVNHLKKENKPIKCCILISGFDENSNRITIFYKFQINPIGFSRAFNSLKYHHSE